MLNLSTKEILALYNQRAEKPLKSWKQSKQALIERFQALPAPHELRSQIAVERSKRRTPLMMKDCGIPKHRPAPQPNRSTSRFRAEELIAAGLGNKEIVKVLHAEFKGSKASLTTVRFYRNQVSRRRRAEAAAK